MAIWAEGSIDMYAIWSLAFHMQLRILKCNYELLYLIISDCVAVAVLSLRNTKFNSI